MTMVSFDDSLDIIDLMRRFPNDHDTMYDYNDRIVGYVNQERVNEYYKIFFISYSPLIFGTIVAIGFFYLSFTFDNFLLSLLTFFIGFSISVNALPSREDEAAIEESQKLKEIKTIRTFLKNAFDTKDFIILTLPFVHFALIFRDKIYLIRGKTKYTFGGYIYPIFLIFISLLILHGLFFVIPIFIFIFCLYTMYKLLNKA